jgi:UDP-N-acetylmuramate: L-alanyl-gamma-D-glutamyl-meso-diaminopimelate ligase
VPSPSLDIYFIAIGGTGMAPLACLLRECGHRVRGSDGPLYPPMSTLLAGVEIEPLEGYDPAHLHPHPDLVIVGNAVPRDNPEAQELERLGLPKLSMPEALRRFVLRGRRPLVVAGTHGKTTITSLAAWIYHSCGADPGYLIGGVPRNLSRSFRLGAGERFIVEGDEYNAAYFDRGPKFFHYDAETLILTSVEYDHVDLYPEADKLRTTYSDLVARLPPQGLLIACGDSPEVREVAEKARCRTLLYGLDKGNELCPLGGIQQTAGGSRFHLHDPDFGRVEVRLPLTGLHNMTNALAVWAAARADGLPPGKVIEALARFQGVRRRAEVVGSFHGITVVDDFAHHPTAVKATLRGLRVAFSDQRLIAVFEPRSLTSARSLFFDQYCDALAEADRVILAPIHYADRFGPGERLNLDGIVAHLGSLGVEAEAVASVDEIVDRLVPQLTPGDLVVTMSSGSFHGLPHRLAAALETQRAHRVGS